MADFLHADDIDFRAYERMTEVRAKVHKASTWADELAAEFDQADVPTTRHPTVTSSAKLEGRLHFRPGEITVWAGYSGHRKSMFLGQVVLDLIGQNERCLIASMEMLPARTLSRMCRQACGPRFPTPARIKAFQRWTDNRLWIFDHVGRVSPPLMLGVARYFADELRGKHVVIDSMMMVCASEESLDEQKQFATDIVRIAQETGLHLHLVAHCRKPQAGEDRPPTKYDVRGSSAITDQAPNVITVWANKGKVAKLEANPNDEQALAEGDALVSIEKQRSGTWEGKARMWFDPHSLRFLDSRTEQVAPYPIED